MKTLHERIPLSEFNKLPSIPQIAKVNCLAWLEHTQKACASAYQAVLGCVGWCRDVLGSVWQCWVVLGSTGMCWAALQQFQFYTGCLGSQVKGHLDGAVCWLCCWFPADPRQGEKMALI